MKREPSVLWPASAKNRSPGLTARLSTARPVTSTASPCGSILASSPKRSRSLILLVRTAALPGAYRDSKFAVPSGLLGCSRCRKNEAVGRRQVETRLDPQEGRNASNNVAPGRHRVPARGDKALGFRQRFRLVQHDQPAGIRGGGRAGGGKRGGP